MTRDDLVKELEKAAQMQAATRDHHISISLSATEAVFRAGDALHIWDTAYDAGAKDEREACAHIVEDWDSDLACPREVADAIRARGKK